MAPSYASKAASGGGKSSGLMAQKKSKPAEIRTSNIQAAKALADAVRTSLGPKGMDKMIQDPKGEVTITNDGATILQSIFVDNPAAKILIDISRTQDEEVGDGTTTVAVLAGELLREAEKLVNAKIHPQIII